MSTWEPTPERSRSSVMWVICPFVFLTPVQQQDVTAVRLWPCTYWLWHKIPLVRVFGCLMKAHTGNFVDSLVAKSIVYPFVILDPIRVIFTIINVVWMCSLLRIHAGWVPIYTVWQVNSWRSAFTRKGIFNYMESACFWCWVTKPQIQFLISA